MAYGWWHFAEPAVNSLEFDVDINGTLDPSVGRYLQLYQGKIGDVGFYLGFQTNVHRPNLGWSGQGIIFSRWETRNSDDARATKSGWVENGGHEGGFVGVRSLMAFSATRYKCLLHPVGQDPAGTWFQFDVVDPESGLVNSAGQLRFPTSDIKSGGGSWTEVYSGVAHEEDVPYTEFRVSVSANNGQVLPVQCHTSYNDTFMASDASVLERQLLLKSGSDVERVQPPKKYLFDN